MCDRLDSSGCRVIDRPDCYAVGFPSCVDTVARRGEIEHRAAPGVGHDGRVARQPSARIARRRWCPLRASRAQLRLGELDIEFALVQIDTHRVTVTYQADRAALGGFG